MQAIRQHLAVIRQLQQQITAAEQQTSSLANRRKQQLARLKSTYEQRRQLLRQIQSRLKDRKTRLAKLSRDQQRLKRLVHSVDSATRSSQIFDNRAFAKRRRKLPWPVAGRIVTSFGAKRGTGRWEGVVIQAAEGTPVKAIHPGRVIFSGWMPGYGQLLIVRHDHHFMTLYAFNQTLLKHIGDRVREGEVIATVGRSGGRSRPGLYFAIRQGSKPVDPKHWCRRARGGRVK
ncbi:MAG TPA: hypothetical protein ENI90_08280 [Methylothermaceae bacterium]|nr:hypothetical protein [Methylothermaceae bacterium]